MRFDVQRVTTGAEFDEVLALRYRVFCDEQGVPREIERDDEDGWAVHALVRSPGGVVATGRVLRQRADGRCVAPSEKAEAGDLARIGRMAVDASARKTGVGSLVLKMLENEAIRAGMGEATLHAQLHAERFYAKHGYHRHGEEFDEAGIGHVEMRKTLRAE